MKFKRTEPVSYDREVVFKVTCDICKEVIPPEKTYEVSEVEVKYRHGTSYPDGGFIEITEFDICPKCFKEKLVPMLKSLGAQPTEYESDF